MVRINKEERDYLIRKNKNYEKLIHHTWGHRRHYWLTENVKAMTDLEKYREDHILYTCEPKK